MWVAFFSFTMIKKILIITYYWPPSGGSGVQRWIYFSKYLHEAGYDVEILTIDPKEANYQKIDESFIDAIKSIKVHTCGGGINFLSFYKSFNKKKELPLGYLPKTKIGFTNKIAGFIRGNFFIPDARVGWSKKAKKKATELMNNSSYSHVITTGPPHSAHLVGLHLKKSYSFKWIADFRDPWTDIYYNELFYQTRFAKNKDSRLEKEVLQQSDIVLTVGPTLANNLKFKIKDSDQQKVKFILNGFDLEKVKSIAYEPYEKTSISFVGLWGTSQPYQELIRALDSLSEELDFTFNIAGTIADEVLEELKQTKKLDYKLLGYVSHIEALKIMSNSTILFTSLANSKDSKLIISGKLMEYLATSNPVVIIGKKGGDAEHLMNQFDGTYFFDFSDLNELKQVLNKLLIQGLKKYDRPKIIQYSREKTCESLIEILEKI